LKFPHLAGGGGNSLFCMSVVGFPVNGPRGAGVVDT